MRLVGNAKQKTKLVSPDNRQHDLISFVLPIASATAIPSIILTDQFVVLKIKLLSFYHSLVVDIRSSIFFQFSVPKNSYLYTVLAIHPLQTSIVELQIIYISG